MGPIDNTPIGMDFEGWKSPNGRPLVTAIIDAYTRQVIGIYFGIKAPSDRAPSNEDDSDTPNKPTRDSNPT